MAKLSLSAIYVQRMYRDTITETNNPNMYVLIHLFTVGTCLRAQCSYFCGIWNMYLAPKVKEGDRVLEPGGEHAQLLLYCFLSLNNKRDFKASRRREH